jgi:plasmid stabilization system protein ParE
LKPVTIRPAAADDIDEAFAWYQRQSPGLGDRIIGALRTTLSAIAANPELYQVLHRETPAAP